MQKKNALNKYVLDSFELGILAQFWPKKSHKKNWQLLQRF